ncbi:MAG: hypothetical protein NTW54_07650 [Bacteroidetes bacterium]|nr:hypothetical protein [Bacteroidota bacterium]
MSNQQPKHLPFHSAEEVLFHIDASTILLERLKSRIELMDKSEGYKRVELENHITKSLSILNDGFVNMILSIQQGYIQKPLKVK